MRQDMSADRFLRVRDEGHRGARVRHHLVRDEDADVVFFGYSHQFSQHLIQFLLSLYM